MQATETIILALAMKLLVVFWTSEGHTLTFFRESEGRVKQTTISAGKSCRIKVYIVPVLTAGSCRTRLRCAV